MRFTIGNHVQLPNGEHGIVCEIVPAGQSPRRVKHTAAWRRNSESYVVAVLSSKLVTLYGHGSARKPTMVTRHRWPNPENLKPFISLRW
jgi:hypothetical protein